MLRLLYAILLGVVGAGIVHISILLLLPLFSDRDAWSRLAAAADLYVVTAADGSDGSAPTVEAPDPFFRAVACRFDLEDGPVRLARRRHGAVLVGIDLRSRRPERLQFQRPHGQRAACSIS